MSTKAKNPKPTIARGIFYFIIENFHLRCILFNKYLKLLINKITTKWNLEFLQNVQIWNFYYTNQPL